MLKKTGQLRDYIVYGSGQVVNLAAPLLVTPYIVAVCGVQNQGKLGVALAVFMLLCIFIDFGSLLLGVKELSINKGDSVKIKKQLDEVYTFRAIVFIILAVLILAVLLLFDIEKKLYLFGITMLLAQLLNPLWIYQAFEEFSTINRIVIVSKSLYIISVYVLVDSWDAYPFMLLCFGGANTLIYGFFLVKLYKKYNLSLFNVPVKTLKDNFRKEYPIVISNFSISAYTSGPILIVSYVGGDYITGLYSIGDTLLKIIRSYLGVFFNVSFPKFCNAYNIDKNRGMAFLKMINKYHLAFIAVSLAAAYTLVPLLIDSFSFDKKLHNGILFCIKFLGLGIIIALNIPFYQLLIYYNRQKAVSVISTSGALIMLLSCYFLTLHYGLNGSVVSLYIVEVFITAAIIVVYFNKVFNRQHHNLTGGI